MARMFKPQALIGNRLRPFSTYTELKKNVKKLIAECPTGELYVYRSRRGEWGEWFEKWVRFNGKPTIIKQGWM